MSLYAAINVFLRAMLGVIILSPMMRPFGPELNRDATISALF